MRYDVDLDVNVNADGELKEFSVGYNITDRGTIFVGIKRDWITDPPERPPVPIQTFDDNWEIGDLPQWEIVWLRQWNADSPDIEGKEAVDAYFVQHPIEKKQIEDAIEKHVATDLFKDVITSGESTAAYALNEY